WLAAGCFGPEARTTLVPGDTFGNTPVVPPARHASYAPAPTEVAAHVDKVGRGLLAANREIGVRPPFITSGAPQPETFHKGTAEIDITEGLVKQCATDGQLAAVLCHELGKMVAEREKLAGPEVRRPERLPPQEVRVGSDNAGSFGPPDLVR